MDKPEFVESVACASRRHCAACRANREFRVLLAQRFRLPDDDVDFECPHGVGAPEGATIPSVFESRVAVCAKCSLLVRPSCGPGRCRHFPGRYGLYTAHRDSKATCPDGHWPS